MVEDRGAEGMVGEDFKAIETQNRKRVENGTLEVTEGEVFDTTSQPFCVKIAD